MISVTTGARVSIQHHVETEGLNVIYAFAKPRTVQGVRGLQNAIKRLTLDDIVEISASIQTIRELCWWRREPSTGIHLNRNVATGIYGVSPGCLSVKNWLPRDGELITEEHNRSGSRVALLGQTVASALFDSDEDPVGSYIRINNVSFKVIGVLNVKGNAPSGYDQDDLILIPFTTAHRVFGAQPFNQVQLLAVSTYEREQLNETAEQMRTVLRDRHRLNDYEPDDFVIRTQLEVERLFEGTGETLGELLIWLAAGSLLVGIIGVFNIALVSVVDRTKEIGIRMAVGATRSQIMLQILLESSILGLLGGTIGIALGILASWGVGYYFDWPIVLNFWPMLHIALVLTFIGAISGIYPAWKASGINPIVALRYE